MYNDEKKQLQAGIDAIAPDILEKIKQQEIKKIESEEELFGCVDEYEKLETVDNKRKFKAKSYVAAFSSVAAVAVACIILAIQFVGRPQVNSDTQIIIDVNPSIQLVLKDDNKVKEISALNDDADKIIKNIDTKKSLDVVIEKILLNLDEYHYLDDKDSAMLITYIGKNDSKAEKIVKKAVDKYIDVNECECEVLYQDIESSKELEKKASKKGVSVGKYYFVQKISTYDITVEYLYEKNIKEIVSIMKDNGIDIPEEITSRGKDYSYTTSNSNVNKDKGITEKEITNSAIETVVMPDIETTSNNDVTMEYSDIIIDYTSSDEEYSSTITIDDDTDGGNTSTQSSMVEEQDDQSTAEQNESDISNPQNATADTSSSISQTTSITQTTTVKETTKEDKTENFTTKSVLPAEKPDNSEKHTLRDKDEIPSNENEKDKKHYIAE